MSQSPSLKAFVCGSCLVLLCAAASAMGSVVEPGNIIPRPAEFESRPGWFKLTSRTRVNYNAAAAEAQFLADRLNAATGFKIAPRQNIGGVESAAINLVLVPEATNQFGAEGYELLVAGKSIIARAATPAGLFYAGQTLLQSLPPEIFSTNALPGREWKIPAMRIQDVPRFGWRGLMLDVSRQFFSKDEVKRVLDSMALRKLNVFHWHLVDDHGWRIEIKKYPALTQIGAWRDGVGFGLDAKSTKAYGSDGRYGGFYTQDDVREIVAYASERHIMVVPEIEMPGHSAAALAAYPEFGCPQMRFFVPTTGHIRFGVYCPGNDETFRFLADVIAEVAPLFPAPYFHIGGDEVVKTNWQACVRCQARLKANGWTDAQELQNDFTRRAERMISAYGKRAVGWSEIRDGWASRETILMDWLGGALAAATNGHDVVMTPFASCYLDSYQTLNQAQEPRTHGGFVPLRRAYAFEPIPAGLPTGFHQHILGAQACEWTEYAPNLANLEYTMFPRLSALAEVFWSPKAARDFEDFKRRLRTDERRLDFLGVNYRRSDRDAGEETSGAKIGGWSSRNVAAQASVCEWEVTSRISAPGVANVHFDHVGGQHALRISRVALCENGVEISTDEHEGVAGGTPIRTKYSLKVPAPKAGAKYGVRARIVGADGNDSLGNVYWFFYPPE